VPTSQGDTTVPTTQAPRGGSCGSSTISTPVRGTVTSDFGPRWGRNHDGIDIAAPTGTAVRAAACGTVSLAGQQSGYGNIVCITHTSQFSTCYAHLSRFGVTGGAHVQQGQIIGYVGCTGSCTGPHLHFETRVNGQAQDPRTYLSGGAIPGRQATVAGTSTTGTERSSTTTRHATVTTNLSGSTTTTTPESVVSAQGEVEMAVPTTSTTAIATEGTPVPAESAPAEVAEPVPVEPAPTEVAVEPVAVEPVAVEPAPTEVAVEAAPVEVAADSVAVEAAPVAVRVAPVAVAADPVEVEAAPAEVEAAPVEVEAAPAEVAAEQVAVEAEPVAVEAAPAAAEPVAVDAQASARAGAPATR